ncbi:ATP-dependent helicase [Rhodococcus sp. 05-2254-5]|uniref:ATP-dependent DNA helicase n=1 Tax=unclassified Rhodococcus (in: high G+C Gram-positive bacteria) TaxID=192944 RepID=UPI000B9B804C|nr:MULTISPECIES: ATP-dependent DNA helicase [unclassified Rhodococcus (in: high G+C Gram-positive bacteria)]OZE38939.1 ATP-dependent helicase [Rhodococcus sp. 05-2254-5]OZE58878.1 ATP-dependent helicase [Rhodococcus sp. 05-2254-1]
MPSKTELPTVPALLQVAVHSLGGKERSNQLTMASAVAHSIDTGEHLAVQAGTGTGKSLAYLVPSIRHAVESGKTVIVSTATIALQRQLVDRDLPRLSDALTEAVGRRPKFAILKGRNNYLCMNKIHTGAAQEAPDAELFDPFAVSRMGREVVRLTKWSSETETGDRDDVVPGVSDQAWRQVSVTARECLGKSRCPVGEDCFAERARTEAAQVDVVVTNHALLAIDAITGIQILPEHDVVVVDEAHELVDRVTGVATEELSAATVTAAARRSAKLIEEETVDQLEGAAENWAAILDELPPGRWQSLPDGVGPALASVRDAAWAVRTAIGPNKQGMAGSDPEAAAARSAALVAVDEVHDSAVRVLTAFDEPDPAKRKDVVWHAVDDFRGNVKRTVRIAPLSVGGLLRARLFAESTVVLTSATLTVGGSFDGLAVNWGLPAEKPSRSDTAMASGVEPPSDNGSIRWSSLDVGSPFDHARAGIMYIAKHLSPPGRDGLSKSSLDEIESLVEAAGGRTLGLFSSMRAAKAAAEEMRERLDTPILCQGDDSTGALVQKFADDEATSLFGTLSLWQGVDVPGPSLSLVILDRIPFPRPDDPLLVARQQAVESRGGNGFLAVAANHAALLLAQGVGRLLRSVDDKGVVAVLDSRLATARYGGYLRASLPPFWETSDPEVVRKALTRLAGK